MTNAHNILRSTNKRPIDLNNGDEVGLLAMHQQLVAEYDELLEAAKEYCLAFETGAEHRSYVKFKVAINKAEAK